MNGFRCRLAASLGALILSSSCAWLPEPGSRATMTGMPRIDQTLAAAQRSLPVRANWPTVNWWLSFAAPPLNRLIETALKGSPTLKMVEARLHQAQTLVDAEAADQYPTVSANIGFSAQRFSANSVQAKLAGEHFRQLLINPFVLRYHLDLWGRDRAALEAAIGKAQAAEIEVADARLLLSAAVAGTYFDLAAAQARLTAAEKITADREEWLKWAETRLTTGLASNAPLLKARIDLHDAKQLEAAVRAEIALHKNRLAALAGKGPDWGRQIAAEHLRLPSLLPLPADLPLRLLSHRPDVQAARLRAEAAAKLIEVAKTAFYPDVNLLSFAGLHSVSMTDVLLQGSSLAYAVGPSIDFPIFEGGRLRADLQYQETAYDEAVERYNAQVLHAVQEVADVLANWQKIGRQVDEQQQTLAAAEAARQLAEAEYRAGLNDRRGLIEANAAASAQHLRLAALEGDYCKTAAQLARALGGGYLNKTAE
ncbi:efflux transporter outer membrane subunit [Methylomicrobium sp. Wu6]|uniref:efflux transporter outer membrane subunit n=1 Tax=Methylomicrobium sp. Wu6 TaxID=3107928 RepID=UPI002DD69273|nr:efflux transporter outer membrane subunit [Methylomicrobium sp. Wu6]MEC4748379.1 efflux transporter outer membrane subunit [Methylomicrobium sp. Wu6]